MKNLFIPYELAVIAKEKGFKEACFRSWYKAPYDEAVLTSEFDSMNPNAFVLAPLYQQIIDWLREAHNIHFTNIEDAGLYSFTVKWHNGLYFIKTSCKGGDYYEALINAIKKAFGLIESNTNIPPADETFDGSRI